MTTLPTNLLTAIGMGAIAGASSITVSLPATATTLTGVQTSGNQMVGLEVTANFVDGGSQTLTWAATGSTSGGVSTAHWSLNESGDTFNSPWTFTNNGRAIRSLLLSAVPGNAVFDTVDAPELTPGSGRGRSFSVQSGLVPTSFAYSEPIDISLGDLFGNLTLNYDNGFVGTTTFIADTDSSVITDPGQPKVPTPALLPGLIALGISFWRKYDRQ